MSLSAACRCSAGLPVTGFFATAVFFVVVVAMWFSVVVVVGGSGPDRDLDHLVALVAEELVGVLDLIQREAVGHEPAEVDAAVTDQLHQLAHPLLAARAQRREDLLVADA